MGTSKSFTTPSGGSWTPLKNDLSNFLSGNSDFSPEHLVGSTIAAAGLGLSRLSASTGGGGARPGAGGSLGRGARRSSARAVGGSLAGLAGFGSAVQADGLTQALERFDLGDLRDRSAAEIIARLAERLALDADGPQKEVITAALMAAIFEAAQIQGDESYDDLETALEQFLASRGIDGLIEVFLCRCVYDGIWFAIEQHIGMKSDTNTDVRTLALAVESSCRAEVRAAIKEHQDLGTFERTNWFGTAGQRVARGIVKDLDDRLRALRED